ncbi:GNAT family N-acetyltransferase [Enterococcus ratti]|uniref:GNAT family N-acetyltransferase n=1 Tax=Enterococcus ratti TaxID=150033 RepID=UPI003516C846
MMNNKYQKNELVLLPEIKKLAKTNLPWSLLLAADPEKEKVQQYLVDGTGFIWQKGQTTYGVIVFVTRESEFEIMNVAVATDLQGKGIGYTLLLYTLKELQNIKTTQKKIIVRTGSLTSNALHLYKKLGFIEQSREKDYFIKNYKSPIYENGELLRDQVTLEKTI